MKKSILLLIPVLIICLAGTVLGADYDFKTLSWGATTDDIISVEGEPLSIDRLDGSDDTLMVYASKAVGMDVGLGYFVGSDGLYQVKYLLEEKHSNNNKYVEDYGKFRDAITKKYGEPLIDQEIWTDKSKQDFYANRKGDAVCYGYLEYLTIWYMDRTTIGMGMEGDNYEISTCIQYWSNEISGSESDYSDDL